MTDELIDALASAEEALADLSEVGGEWAVVAGIPCARLPVPYPWAAQAKALTPPSPGALAEALRWLGVRSASGGTVTTRRAHVDRPVFTDAGLRPVLVLGVMATLAEPVDLPAVPGLEIGPARSAAEFRTVFASFGTDLTALVTQAHLDAPSYRHVVGRFGGAPVGCAVIRLAAGTCQLAAVAVLPEFRGLGVGTAVSAWATRAAQQWCAGPVWLHAEAPLQPLYHRLGYRWVDDHVQLRLSAGDN